MEVADIMLQTFLVNHPYYMKQICCINKMNFDKCRDRGFLNQLVKTWLFPHLSYSEIQRSYCHLNFSDIVEYALFFSPIPESLGNYNPLSLYFQACSRSEETDCKVFVDHICNNYLSYNNPEHYIAITALIAFKYGHMNTLYDMFHKFVVQHSTRHQYQLTIEYVRRKVCLFLACVLGDTELISKSWKMLKDLNNGKLPLIHEDCLEMIDIIESAYIGLSPIDYAQIVGDWLSLEWGENLQCLEVYTASLKAKSKLIITHSNSLSSISRFGGSLASLLNDEEIESVVSRFDTAKKAYVVEKGFIPYLPAYLAGCWSNRSSYTIDSLFIHRPDLLTEEELFDFPKSAYIESDNYELYMIYHNDLPNRPSNRIVNWLGVNGYNCQFARLAADNDVVAENM